MKQNSDIHRLLRIVMMVQGPGVYPAERLASELGVSERTVFRDIKKLCDTGVPVVFDERTGGYRVGTGFFLPPLQLTADEALALAVLCDDLAQKEQIAFLAPAWRALAKIEAQLPPEARAEIDAMAGHVVVRTAQADPGEGSSDVYDRMRQSIATRRSLRCEYESPASVANGVPAERESFIFEPYALLFSVRAWYALGRREGREGVRCLKLSRFSRVSTTDASYEIPTGFSVEKHLGNAWRLIPGPVEHDIILRFESPFSETVSDTLWHPTQTIEHEPDGSIIMRLRVAGLDEIVWWVLSMGPSCRVIQPDSLAQRVRDLAMTTARLYQT
ncbi:MAG: WYL domain-containing protein [Phycisphaeraceae bacterium]|nr:WYL domain-containing protein [Phycisphaeraceae bacterium]